MNASMELPIPSGIKTEIPESANLSTPILFLTKYRDILNISLSMLYNKETREYELNTSDIELSVTLDTVDKIKLFSLLLEDIKDLTKPEINQISQLLQLAYLLMTTNITSFRFSNPMLIIALFSKLENLVNKHNLYFDRLSKYNLDKIVNNYSLYSMYKTACDAANLILALTSVDGTTGPLKDVADESSESKEATTRTPGNVFNKFQSIVENLVGKQGIGICAVGLKAFFGLTLYNNYILNRGTAELQLRLLLGNQHRGHLIGGNIYRTLANIRSKDPNTITNADVLEALSLVNNDSDAALVLSALLSLATD